MIGFIITIIGLLILTYEKDYEDIDYKVADINMAEFGRREISLAENEMPALWHSGKNIKMNSHCLGLK